MATARVRFGGLLLCFLMALVWAGNGLAQGDPVYGGIIRFGAEADPEDFDPHRYQGGSARDIKSLIYNSLVTLDANGEVVPYLAESWTWESPTVLEFKLREDVRFHDGSTLTSDDVKFSYQRIMAPETAAFLNSVFLQSIADIETPDDRTVRLLLTEPNASILVQLALPDSAAIVSRVAVEGGLDLTRQPMGTGPFRFVEHEPGAFIVLERNPYYFLEGKPYADGVRISILRDEQSRANALLTGEVDVINFVSNAMAFRIEQRRDLALVCSLSTITAIMFNTSRSPFDDVRVRQAISYAVDRQAVLDAAYLGRGREITGGVILEPWASPELEGTYTRDLERARELLAEAGYADGFSVSLMSSAIHSHHYLTAEIVQQNLKDIGISVDLDLVEWATTVSRQAVGDYDFRIQGTSYRIPDPDGLALMFPSDSAYWAEPIGYVDEVLDDLISRSRSELDPQARQELVTATEARLLETVPWSFLAYGESCSAAVDTSKLGGFVVGPWPGLANNWSKVQLQDVWLSDRN